MAKIKWQRWGAILLTLALIVWLVKSLTTEDKFRLKGETPYAKYYNAFQDLIDKVAEELGTELHVYTSGYIRDNTEMDDHLRMEFYLKRLATVDEARALQFYIKDKFFQALQRDTSIQSYLPLRPFPAERILVDLDFRTYPDKHYAGCIDHVHDYQTSVIYYDFADPIGEPDKLEETYSEAEKRLKASPIVDLAIHHPTALEFANDKILDRFSKDMDKFGLSIRSIGAKMYNGQERIDIEGVVNSDRSTIKEGRKLLIKAVERLTKEGYSPHQLKMLIEYQSLKPFVTSIDLTVTLDSGIITYSNEEKNSESYQEAKRIIENAPPPTLLDLGLIVIENIYFALSAFFNLLGNLLVALLYRLALKNL